MPGVWPIDRPFSSEAGAPFSHATEAGWRSGGWRGEPSEVDAYQQNVAWRRPPLVANIP
jgi:hypothetical protein